MVLDPESVTRAMNKKMFPRTESDQSQVGRAHQAGVEVGPILSGCDESLMILAYWKTFQHCRKSGAFHGSTGNRNLGKAIGKLFCPLSFWGYHEM